MLVTESASHVSPGILKYVVSHWAGKGETRVNHRQYVKYQQNIESDVSTQD